MKLHRRSKNNKKPILRQVLDLIPAYILGKSVRKFQTDKGCHKYKTYDQLVALSFGQLGKCYTLSDISCGLSISSTFMLDLGLKQNPVCLLYTSDAADDLTRVDLGGRRI